jgi:hypothetical protein
VLLAHEGGQAVQRLGPGRAANALRARADAWAKDPLCSECHARIPSPDEAGWCLTATGERLVCRRPCLLDVVRREYMATRANQPHATRAGAR